MKSLDMMGIEVSEHTDEYKEMTYTILQETLMRGKGIIKEKAMFFFINVQAIQSPSATHGRWLLRGVILAYEKYI